MKTFSIDQKYWTISQRNLISKNLKALAHPVRLAIIEMLKNDRRMTVTEIYTALDADQSFISHHLSILRDKQVLGTQRMGKFVTYYLKNEAYAELVNCLYSIQNEEVITSYY